MFSARIVSTDFPGDKGGDLIARQTKAGGLIVRNQVTGDIARRISPSTVENRGGYLKALQFAYPTGLGYKYWYTHIVILSAS